MAEEWEIISTYTRKEALEDGVLIDVSEMAKEVGFVVPVAITDNLQNTWIKPPAKMEDFGQSCEGRLWDVLHMLRMNCRRNNAARIKYEVLFQNTPKRLTTVELISTIGPDDNGDPVITIMLPEDD